MSNQPDPVVDRNICNAESVSLSEVLCAIASARSSVYHLQSVAGLSKNSEGKPERDRWEITQAKVYVLNLLEDQIKALPTYVMGEKPDVLNLLEFERARFRRLAISCSDLVFKSLEERRDCEDFRKISSQYARFSEISEFLADFLRPFRPFPGNAEEQPGPRDESPGPIGEKPCDGPGGESMVLASSDAEEFSHWLGNVSSAEVLGYFEAARAELESRGVVLHWSISGI